MRYVVINQDRETGVTSCGCGKTRLEDTGMAVEDMCERARTEMLRRGLDLIFFAELTSITTEEDVALDLLVIQTSPEEVAMLLGDEFEKGLVKGSEPDNELAMPLEGLARKAAAQCRFIRAALDSIFCAGFKYGKAAALHAAHSDGHLDDTSAT